MYLKSVSGALLLVYVGLFWPAKFALRAFPGLQEMTESVEQMMHTLTISPRVHAAAEDKVRDQPLRRVSGVSEGVRIFSSCSSLHAELKGLHKGFPSRGWEDNNEN